MSLPNPVQYHVFRGQPLPRPLLYGYALAGQGVIKFTETDFFSAAITVANGALITGLPLYPTGIRLGLPRIPGHWLATVLNHARQAGTGNQVLRPVEQMYHFHWLDNDWKVAVPRQAAKSTKVDYRGGHETSIVLDLHSHAELPAFFSETDDADEQGARFYAVIGRIYTRPELRLRVGVYGDWLEFDPLALFENLGPFIPAERLAL